VVAVSVAGGIMLGPPASRVGVGGWGLGFGGLGFGVWSLGFGGLGVWGFGV